MTSANSGESGASRVSDVYVNDSPPVNRRIIEAIFTAPPHLANVRLMEAVTAFQDQRRIPPPVARMSRRQDADQRNAPLPAGRNRRKQGQQKLDKRSRQRAKVEKEIFFYRQTPGFLIPRAPFNRVTREVLKKEMRKHKTTFRMTKDAYEAIQEAAETEIVAFLKLTSSLAKHANRRTINKKDANLARKIRGVEEE